MPTACYDSAGSFLGIYRSLFDINVDLNALTAAQKTSVWNDLSSGTPAMYRLDEGLYAGAVSVFDWVLTAGPTLTAAQITAARLRLAACYLYDNPTYLTNPGFDPTINVKPYI